MVEALGPIIHLPRQFHNLLVTEGLFLKSAGTFLVESIKEIEERIRTAPPFLYPGDSPVEITQRTAGGPYKTTYLKDPDGNYVDISEEGWEV